VRHFKGIESIKIEGSKDGSSFYSQYGLSESRSLLEISKMIRILLKHQKSKEINVCAVRSPYLEIQKAVEKVLETDPAAGQIVKVYESDQLLS